MRAREDELGRQPREGAVDPLPQRERALTIRREGEAVAVSIEGGKVGNGQIRQVVMGDRVAGSNHVAHERVGVTQRDGEQRADQVWIRDRPHRRISGLQARRRILRVEVSESVPRRTFRERLDVDLLDRQVLAAVCERGAAVHAGRARRHVDVAARERRHQRGAVSCGYAMSSGGATPGAAPTTMRSFAPAAVAHSAQVRTMTTTPMHARHCTRAPRASPPRCLARSNKPSPRNERYGQCLKKTGVRISAVGPWSHVSLRGTKRRAVTRIGPHVLKSSLGPLASAL